ncbi:MAG: hypothetical protein IT289_05540 [Oligoflexia bacterium]|nr:hypothetical protein [Oligoflexia bacterium]
MKKINKFVIIYFLCALPIIAFMVFSEISEKLNEMAKTEGWADWVNSALGFSMGFWMLSAIYLGVALIGSSAFREELVRRLVRIKERDEREVAIAGAAAKKVFFSTIAIISFLLVLTLFQINVSRLPEGKIINGKKHVLSLGLKFSPWDKEFKEPAPESERFGYRFPLSTSAVLLGILLWQLGTFHWYSRKVGSVND